jgi:hypothetical protein
MWASSRVSHALDLNLPQREDDTREHTDIRYPREWSRNYQVPISFVPTSPILTHPEEGAALELEANSPDIGADGGVVPFASVSK